MKEEFSDEEALTIQLVENLQRKDLTEEEKALALAELARRTGWNPGEIADHLRMSYTWVVKYLPDQFKTEEKAGPGKLGGEARAEAYRESQQSATQRVATSEVKAQDLSEGKIREILDSPKGKEVVASMLHEQGIPTLAEPEEKEPLFADHIETTEGKVEPEEGPTPETEETTKTTLGTAGTPAPEHVHRKIEGMQVGEFTCPECKQKFFIDHISAKDHRLTFIGEDSE